jgi:hypothetical protein
LTCSGLRASSKKRNVTVDVAVSCPAKRSYDLVAQLPIGEARAILVFGVEQQAQNVRPPLAARPPTRDLRENHRVEPRPGAVHRPPR